MRLIVFFTFVFVLVVTGCQPSETKRGKAMIEQAHIDSLLMRYFKLNRFSGAVVVKRNDTLIYNNSVGLANYQSNIAFSDTTSFKVGAITELFTARIIREMESNGLLRLEDTVANYVPAIKKKFTIEALLAHTSGLQTIGQIRETNPNLDYDPIAYANYSEADLHSGVKSDLGYNVLGLVIESISGDSYQNVLDKYCLKWGLENTYFDKEYRSQAKGYTGYSNYRGLGMELHESEILEPRLAFSSRGLKSSIYDVLTFSEKLDTVALSGYLPTDGFSYSLLKDEVITMVVLSNYRHPVAGEITKSISSLLRGESYDIPLRRQSVQVDTVTLDSFVGRYLIAPTVSFEVKRRSDSLFVSMGENETFIVPQSQNQFFFKDMDAAMRFVLDTEGKVSEVELLNGFLYSDQKAKKILD
ncbi:MAG: serine hydrolase [Bacteroidetes bacterium]|nr:serine hydrolase [Bacteroidota bacterium]